MTKLLRKDLLQLSQQWMGDARVLFAANRHAGAYHAGGVALECLLKAKIARQTQAEEFPDKRFAAKVWEHEPVALLALAELDVLMVQATPAVRANWITVKDWRVDSRYTHTVSSAIVTAFLDALDHPTDGVLSWLRTHC